MALGQGIHDILKYKDIAEAGQPQNLTGEALVQLGALFTQMDFDFKKDKEALSDDDKKFIEEYESNNISDINEDEVLSEIEAGEKEAFDLLAGIEDDILYLEDLEIENDLGTKTKTNTKTKQKKVIRGRGGVLNNSDSNVSRKGGGGRGMGSGQNINPTTTKTTRSFLFRLKDDNPIKRLQQEHPQILKILQDLRYKQPSEVDSPLFRAAHIASSPFVKTDGVDYRYMKRATMPEYAKGSLGSAAAEGYNLVIDKRNYDQAVKKDYETELDDEMGDLNIEADTINEQTRKDYLELSMNKKQKFNSLFQAYANNEISKLDFENGKAALVSELDAVAGAQTNLTKLRADYLKNKGTYHIDASKPEIVDFYNTLEKNPESFTMKTIDDIDYFIGSTRQGKEVRVPTSKIANGTAGFRLVEKASITPVVASALKAVGTYSEEGMTDYGFGKRSASPERAKEIGMANIKNALAQDESKLRSFMASIYGVDHETYKNFIGDDPTANREEMLNDAAEHLYETQVKPQFFPTQKTTRIDPSKVPFANQKEAAPDQRARQQTEAFVKQYDSLGEITQANVSSLKQGKITGAVLKDGKLQVRVGNSAITLSNDPATRRKQIIQLQGGQLRYIQ